MTVKELRERLAAYPDDMIVVTWDSAYGGFFCALEPTYIVEVNRPYFDADGIEHGEDVLVLGAEEKDIK